MPPTEGGGTTVASGLSPLLPLVGMGGLLIAFFGRRSAWLRFVDVDGTTSDPITGDALPETSSLGWLLVVGFVAVFVWCLGLSARKPSVEVASATAFSVTGIALFLVSLRAEMALPAGFPVVEGVSRGAWFVLLGGALMGLTGLLAGAIESPRHGALSHRSRPVMMAGVLVVGVVAGLLVSVESPATPVAQDGFVVLSTDSFVGRATGGVLAEQTFPWGELVLIDNRVAVFGSERLWEVRENRMYRTLDRELSEGPEGLRSAAFYDDSIYLLLWIDDVMVLERYNLTTRERTGRLETAMMKTIAVDQYGTFFYSTFSDSDEPGVYTVSDPFDSEADPLRLRETPSELRGVITIDGEHKLLIEEEGLVLAGADGARVVLTPDPSCRDRWPSRIFTFENVAIDIDGDGRVFVSHDVREAGGTSLELLLIEPDGTTRSRVIDGRLGTKVLLDGNRAFVRGDELIEIPDLEAFFSHEAARQHEPNNGCPPA